MLLSQPKPGSLPPVSRCGQSLLQQELGDLPVTRGLRGVAGPSLAIPQLGVGRAVEVLAGNPRLPPALLWAPCLRSGCCSRPQG